MNRRISRVSYLTDTLQYMFMMVPQSLHVSLFQGPTIGLYQGLFQYIGRDAGDAHKPTNVCNCVVCVNMILNIARLVLM